MAKIDRFLKYVKIDTQSDDKTGTTPSTEKQKNLSRVLVEELKKLGVASKDGHSRTSSRSGDLPTDSLLDVLSSFFFINCHLTEVLTLID